jgi:hypothetical protein
VLGVPAIMGVGGVLVLHVIVTTTTAIINYDYDAYFGQSWTSIFFIYFCKKMISL